jgi:hypothetical protein
VPGDGTVGLRFPSRDAGALQEMLARVLADDAERAQLVAEAREHVLRFDWGEVARRTLGVYAGLTGPVPAVAPGTRIARTAPGRPERDRARSS